MAKIALHTFRHCLYLVIKTDRVIFVCRPGPRGAVLYLYLHVTLLMNIKIPEDLYMLIKKAVAVRKHLERNRKDKDSKFRLILIESRIHRLSRYYKSVGVLPPTWRYESATASTLVS
jgi:ribosomal protein S15P/S13E